MGISWSDAVQAADNPDDQQRYLRAVSQAEDLEPLILSFVDAVRSAGAWPVLASEEETLFAGSRNGRKVSIRPDGEWTIDLGDTYVRLGIDGQRLMWKRPGEEVSFSHEGETAAKAAEDFGARMDAMEESKDWVPRELVAYLRNHGIPIPD